VSDQVTITAVDWGNAEGGCGHGRHRGIRVRDRRRSGRWTRQVGRAGASQR